MTDGGGRTAEQALAGLAEEIRLLVELVAERAAPWLDGLVAAGHGTGETGRTGEPGEPEEPEQPERTAEGTACGWCPLCAVVAVARGERPEFVARLVEQATQLVALLRAVLADRWEPQDGVHMPGFRPQRGERDSSPRVQHITVRRRERAHGGESGER